MDEKENKLADPVEAVKFMAELFRGINTKLDQQNKFKTVYANNFHFEPSTWDLKIILGQLEQHTGATTIDWHTALTIPWTQVKLVAYYLRVQAAWYEALNGPITAPAGVMPKVPEPPTGEAENDPAAIAWHEASKKIYLEMFG
jgi:hypothetical protein